MRQKQIKLHRERDEPIITIGAVNTIISDIDPAGKKSVRTKLIQDHHLSARYKGHLRTTSSNNSRIHLILKLTRNIHQDRSHSGQKTTP